MLCYAVLCYAVLLGYAMLCCTLLCCTARLCYLMLYCKAMLCYAMLYCKAMLCYAALCFVGVTMSCHDMNSSWFNLIRIFPKLSLLSLLFTSLSFPSPPSHPSWLHQELYVQVPLRCMDVRKRICWREGKMAHYSDLTSHTHTTYVAAAMHFILLHFFPPSCRLPPSSAKKASYQSCLPIRTSVCPYIPCLPWISSLLTLNFYLRTIGCTVDNSPCSDQRLVDEEKNRWLGSQHTHHHHPRCDLQRGYWGALSDRILQCVSACVFGGRSPCLSI